MSNSDGNSSKIIYYALAGFGVLLSAAVTAYYLAPANEMGDYLGDL